MRPGTTSYASASPMVGRWLSTIEMRKTGSVNAHEPTKSRRHRRVSPSSVAPESAASSSVGSAA